MTHAMRWAATLAMLTTLSTSAVGAEPSILPRDFPGIPAHPLDSIQDVAAGPAAIRGRVVHERESAELGGITIVLYALPRAGEPGLRGAVTDETGAFAFESIANDPATVYLLGARYAEIPFGARFSFEAGELERKIDLSVADATSETSGAAIGEVRIEVEKNCESLSVLESHQLENPGTRAIFIPESERNGREPILLVTLPDGASKPQFELGEALEGDGSTLSFWGPLRPGQQEVEFSYQIPERGPAFEMSRSFPSGARRLVLVESPGGPTLTRSGPDDAELRPGDSIALRVELPAAADAVERISALESRIWLEFDGAALTVDFEYTLAVDGNTPLRSESGAPLFCVPLPEGAGDFRLSSGTRAMGASLDPSGALAVRGPLSAGESQIALRFLLPIERDDPLYSQVMPLDTPLVSVLIADTGLAVETSRLHRKRPIRRPDRNYLHLEAFEFSAGEPVELRLQPLEARRSLPLPAAMGIALSAAAIAIGFLIAPLRQAGTETSVPPSAASRAADQRSSVLTAIRGLDEDFEIGKLTETDHREMRLTLRAEAVELLRVERAALAEAAGAERAPIAEATGAESTALAKAAGTESTALAKPTGTDGALKSCPGCEAETGADARFCSQCGAPLNPGGPADGVSPV
jgi:hypothetical protein